MIEAIIADLEDRNHKSIENVKKEFSHIRTGRATLSVLEDVRVEVYGQQMPINQLASMSVPEARVIQITPWDQSTSQVIDRALQKANLGLGINSDGKVIRVVFPELNEERRKEFVKSAHGKAEEGRIAIRNIRRDANDHVKALQAKHEISEDDGKRALDEIQKKSDEAIKQLNHHLEAKEKEIMEI